MTEIPEHLLNRSRERRVSLSAPHTQPSQPPRFLRPYETEAPISRIRELDRIDNENTYPWNLLTQDPGEVSARVLGAVAARVSDPSYAVSARRYSWTSRSMDRLYFSQIASQDIDEEGGHLLQLGHVMQIEVPKSKQRMVSRVGTRVLELAENLLDIRSSDISEEPISIGTFIAEADKAVAVDNFSWAKITNKTPSGPSIIQGFFGLNTRATRSGENDSHKGIACSVVLPDFSSGGISLGIYSGDKDPLPWAVADSARVNLDTTDRTSRLRKISDTGIGWNRAGYLGRSPTQKAVNEAAMTGLTMAAVIIENRAASSPRLISESFGETYQQLIPRR